MTEEEIRKEVVRIAVAEIGKKHVASATVKPDIEFDGAEALEIGVVLKADAPRITGKTYIAVLLKTRDFLFAQKDERHTRLALGRAPRARVAASK